jgi:hypothetical protein
MSARDRFFELYGRPPRDSCELHDFEAWEAHIQRECPEFQEMERSAMRLKALLTRVELPNQISYLDLYARSSLSRPTEPGLGSALDLYLRSSLSRPTEPGLGSAERALRPSTSFDPLASPAAANTPENDARREREGIAYAAIEYAKRLESDGAQRALEWVSAYLSALYADLMRRAIERGDGARAAKCSERGETARNLQSKTGAQKHMRATLYEALRLEGAECAPDAVAARWRSLCAIVPKCADDAALRPSLRDVCMSWRGHNAGRRTGLYKDLSLYFERIGAGRVKPTTVRDELARPTRKAA